MTKIQWGIIGCGDVTEIKSGPAFNKVNNSSLVAVMRRNREKAKDYAQRHGVAKFYDDAQALIDDVDVNAIYIATPPLFHEEYTIKALKAGKPVYVEKPMAINAAAAERMLNTAIKTGIKLTIAHYRRAQPLFKKIRSVIHSGALGELRLVNLQLLQPPQSGIIAKTEEFWRVDPSLSGGGLFHDLAPHQLDLMLYFLGKHMHAWGAAGNQAGLYAADDLVAGHIRFENGVFFNGIWSFAVTKEAERDTCEIIGSDGKISFSVFKQFPVILNKNGKEEVFEFEPLQHVQQPMIEKVVEYFLDQSPNPCSAEEGVESMQIIDAFTGKSGKQARLAKSGKTGKKISDI